MFQPWLAHSFPGMTLPLLEAGYWSLSGYVAMADAVDLDRSGSQA